MIVGKFAIFHKYWDGDFPCYGPEKVFFATYPLAERALATGKYDDPNFPPVIINVSVEKDMLK